MSDRKIHLAITGMSCAHCKKTVENSIKELDGIKSVDVNLEQASADVTFDDAKTDPKKIIEAVNATEVYKVV